MAGAGLGDEEGAGEVDVEEVAEHGGAVRFGLDVGALCTGERGKLGERASIFLHSPGTF